MLGCESPICALLKPQDLLVEHGARATAEDEIAALS